MRKYVNSKKFIVILILFSMLPGIAVSAVLFFRALSNDISNQNIRNAVASVDLSQVEFEPDMDFPKTAFRANEVELTIQGVLVSDFDGAVQILGDDYITIEKNSRDSLGYDVYIDRDNNLEFRINMFGMIDLMRIDNRSSMEFLLNRDKFYRDETRYHNDSDFDMLEPQIIFYQIRNTFKGKNFLYKATDYFILPFYSAAWIFPLLFAVWVIVFKRSKKRIVGVIISVSTWYLLLRVFCFFTFIARQ